MAADKSKIPFNFLHDSLKDGNRLIVDFFIEKRWFYQEAKCWGDAQAGLLDRCKTVRIFINLYLNSGVS